MPMHTRTKSTKRLPFKSVPEQNRINQLFKNIEGERGVSNTPLKSELTSDAQKRKDILMAEHNTGRFRRGEIYFVAPSGEEVGSEILKCRPAVIISNPALCNTASVLEVVYLTTQPKQPTPEHIAITSSGKPSTALADQISSVSISRIRDFCGTCTPDEMYRLEQGILASVGVDKRYAIIGEKVRPASKAAHKATSSVNNPSPEELNTLRTQLVSKEAELAEAKMQLSVLQNMYSELIDRVMAR